MMRRLVYAILGLGSVVLVIGGAGFGWLWATLPETDGTIEVPVLEQPLDQSLLLVPAQNEGLLAPVQAPDKRQRLHVQI